MRFLISENIPQELKKNKTTIKKYKLTHGVSLKRNPVC